MHQINMLHTLNYTILYMSNIFQLKIQIVEEISLGSQRKAICEGNIQAKI